MQIARHERFISTKDPRGEEKLKRAEQSRKEEKTHTHDKQSTEIQWVSTNNEENCDAIA